WSIAVKIIVHAIGCADELDLVADDGDVQGQAIARADGIEISHLNSTSIGAVRAPELIPVRAVSGHEIDSAVDRSQGEVTRTIRINVVLRGASESTDIDVLDHNCAGQGTIRLPELGAVNTVICREKECAVDVRQALRRGVATQIYVPHQGRASLCAV